MELVLLFLLGSMGVIRCGVERGLLYPFLTKIMTYFYVGSVTNSELKRGGGDVPSPSILVDTLDFS